MKRSLTLLAGAIGASLVLVVGVGVASRAGQGAAAPAVVASIADTRTGGASALVESLPPAVAPTTAVAPVAAAPTARVSTPTPTVATARTAPPTTAAAPLPTVAPAKLPPGQRVNPTSAQVQAAIAALHQRIPLFAPTDQQLRTFADAVCMSFDQGQTQAQVQSTVQQAVARIQGASLSAPDADFAVRTVVALRCPGYLP